MAEEKKCTPYREKMMEQLNRLALAEVTEAAGMDLAASAGSLQAFRTDSVEKIGIGCFSDVSGSQYCLCTIIPKPEYALPLFVSIWNEQAGEITFLVDIMPTVDTLVDEEYRKKYIETMGPAWDRFAKLPGIRPEEDDELRSICSIIYTAAVVPVEKEGMRLAVLAPHTEYLKSYIDYLEAAEASASDEKQKEVRRKTAALRKLLRAYFRRVVGGPAGQLIGADAADLLLAVAC